VPWEAARKGKTERKEKNSAKNKELYRVGYG
jgi:hypothetical protein